MNKRFRKFSGFVIILLGACFILGNILLSQYRVVPIMMYHNVDYSDSVKTDTVSTERFRTHMEYLKKNNFQVIALEELVNGLREGEKFSNKTVVLTFDDGYANNFKHAFPILKEYGYQATFFIPPTYIEEVGFMNWEQIRHLQQSGFSLGSHGLTQTYLPGLSKDRILLEIEASKRILEENLNKPVRHFAYPIGGFSDEIKEYIKDAGYTAALTTNRGHDRFNKDLYELNRIRFSDRDDRTIHLWGKLSGYNNLWRRLKQPY